VALLGTISAGQMRAQPTSGKPDGAAVCFNASPLPRCRSFAVVEVALMPIHNRHPESFTDPTQLSYFGSLEDFVSVELGWLRNRANRSAVGATLAVGTMSGDAGRYAVKGRYRWWLPSQFALDADAGPLAVSGGSVKGPFGRNGAIGATVGAALAYRDLVAITGNFDMVKGDRAQSAAYVGVRAGSWAAPVFAAGLITLVIATISSIE
jgi:hypothetical protein